MTENLPDIAGTLAVGGGAAYGVRLLHHVVGPTAKVFGATISDYVEFRLSNWFGIAKAAEEALGDDPPDGQVHPRVVHRVLEEATYLDDPVMQRYAGGLLAAARTPEGKDDRAAYYVNLLSSMTANQVRLHHAVYSAIAAHPRQEDHDLADASQAHTAAVRTPVSDAATLLEFDEDVPPLDAVGEAVFTLSREGLLGPQATLNLLSQLGSSVGTESQRLAVMPSAVGALLFLWGRGVRTSRADDLGRRPLRKLNPPGPTFTHAEVGRWFDGPVTVSGVKREIEEDRRKQERLERSPW